MAKDGANSDAKGGLFLCGYLLMNRDHQADVRWQQTKDAGKGGDTRYEENKAGVSLDAQPCIGIGRCSKHRSPVQAHFLWFTAEVPAIVLLFLTGAGGFVSGLLVALLLRSGAKSKS